jgi:hypothetical protein
MITIRKNEINSVILTLNEKTVGSNPYFLQLYSNQNKNNILLPLTGDSSTNIIRYNQYSINESNFNLMAGEYDYYAHQYSGGTITLSASTNIVESGKCRVIGTGYTETIFENNTQNYTFE